jgi:hypothetical protein
MNNTITPSNGPIIASLKVTDATAIEPTSTTKANPPAVDKFLEITKSNGGTIYKPASPNLTNGGNFSSSALRFCCAVCQKSIPKTHVRYQLTSFVINQFKFNKY